MPLIVLCGHCGRSIKIPDNVAGKTLRCPLCKNTFVAQPDTAKHQSKADRVAPPANTGIVSKPASPAAAKRPKKVVPSEPADNKDALDGPPRRMAALTFKMQVKKDPGRKLKGPCQAIVSSAGLRLKQGKKSDLQIPVGTQTQYREGHVLTVDIEGRQIELSITSFTLYRERLARELAEFLQGKRRGLCRDDYRIPWYVYVPAALPLGIPMITLGGAVPGALGFGLAGGCVAVAQRERWSVGIRVAVMLALVVAGYMGLGAFLYAVGKFKAPVQVTNAPSAAPARLSDKQPTKGIEKTKGAEKQAVASNVPDSMGRVFLPGDAVGLAFSPANPQVLIAVSSNGTVHRWDVANAREIDAIPFKEGGLEVTGLAIAPDESKAVVIRHGGAVHAVDLRTRSWDPPWQQTLPAQPAQWAVAFAPDGKTLATANGDRAVKLMDVASRSWRPPLSGHKDQVHSVVISPDSTTVASGDCEMVRLWNTATGKETGSFKAQDGGGRALPALWALAFSPDGKILAAGGNDGSIRLHALKANSEVARLNQGFPVAALAFSSDGTRLASAGFGSTVQVWDIAASAKVAELDVKAQRTNAIAFQPGHNRLAIASPQLILWNLPGSAGSARLKN
jgi:DNA-binding beta-propeller fold protein YncE